MPSPESPQKRIVTAVSSRLLWGGWGDLVLADSMKAVPCRRAVHRPSTMSAAGAPPLQGGAVGLSLRSEPDPQQGAMLYRSPVQPSLRTSVQERGGLTL